MGWPAAIRRANLWIARSGRWRGPKTVKKRRQVTSSEYRWCAVNSSSSPLRFVDAYGETGFRHGSDSLNGGSLSRPYTDDDDANTSRARAGRAQRVDHALRAGHVDVGVARRIHQRRADARQRRQVHDDLGLRALERLRQRRRVAQVAFDQREPRVGAQAGQVPLLDGARVESVEVVEAQNLIAARAQTLAEM